MKGWVSRPAYCALPIPDTIWSWLAKLNRMLGRSWLTLWNATTPFELTWTKAFVIRNETVTFGDVFVVVVVPVLVLVAGGFEMVMVPVQSEFTV